MDLQKIFIENQSLVAELMEKINDAIEEAGFNAEVDRNGRTRYLDLDAYENQEDVYNSYADILREYDF